MKEYSNFKLLDPKTKKRVALFVRPNEKGNMSVFMILCSKHDFFDKTKARQAYENYKSFGQAYFTKKSKGVYLKPIKEVVRIQDKVVQCTPISYDTDVPFNLPNIKSWVNIAFKKFETPTKEVTYVTTKEGNGYLKTKGETIYIEGQGHLLLSLLQGLGCKINLAIVEDGFKEKLGKDLENIQRPPEDNLRIWIQDATKSAAEMILEKELNK